jgi:protein TonB
MKGVAVPTYTAFDRPRRALPRIAIIIALHALVLFAFVSGDRVTRMKTTQTVLLLATVLPKTVEPPPPPRSRWHESEPRLPAPEVAVPPLRDIEVAPRTEVADTIVDNAMPVEAVGGKSEGPAPPDLATWPKALAAAGRRPGCARCWIRPTASARGCLGAPNNASSPAR